MQIHACLLALHTDRPVKLVYGREESFFGHVHRHPARMQYAHGATRDGRLVFVRARIVLDGGAYASSSGAVVANAACFAVGPVRLPERVDRQLRRVHRQPAVRRDARVRRGADVLRLRVADGPARRGARARPGRAAAAQRDGRGLARCRPARRSRARRRSPSCSSGCGRCRCPSDAPAAPDLLGLPGGVGNATHGEGVAPRRRLRRSASRTSASPRASTTTRPRACGSRSSELNLR